MFSIYHKLQLKNRIARCFLYGAHIIDADLVLLAMIDYKKYDRAIIISSDGDFYSLVQYLYENNKLLKVMSPYVKTCSSLLRKAAKEKIVFMDNLRKKIEYKRKTKKHR